jgi:hypothetical protein
MHASLPLCCNSAIVSPVYSIAECPPLPVSGIDKNSAHESSSWGKRNHSCFKWSSRALAARNSTDQTACQVGHSIRSEHSDKGMHMRRQAKNTSRPCEHPTIGLVIYVNSVPERTNEEKPFSVLWEKIERLVLERSTTAGVCRETCCCTSWWQREEVVHLSKERAVSCVSKDALREQQRDADCNLQLLTPPGIARKNVFDVLSYLLAGLLTEGISPSHFLTPGLGSINDRWSSPAVGPLLPPIYLAHLAP